MRNERETSDELREGVRLKCWIGLASPEATAPRPGGGPFPGCVAFGVIISGKSDSTCVSMVGGVALIGGGGFLRESVPVTPKGLVVVRGTLEGVNSSSSSSPSLIITRGAR